MIFRTPILDAALAALAPGHPFGRGRRERFEQAMQVLATAIEAQKIYNVDYMDAKNVVSTAIEIAAGPLYLAYHKDRAWKDTDTTIDSHVQLNHVAGKLRKLAKSPQASEPTVVAYVAFLNELQPIAEAFESLKKVIVKGRKPSDKPADPTLLENTGTCAICQRRQKLTAGKNLVHHGYVITNGHGDYLGFRNGSCFGVRKQAFELSCEANKEYIAALSKARAAKEGYLARLHAGEITELGEMVSRYDRQIKGYKNEYLVVKLGEKGFDHKLQNEIRKTEGQIRGIELTIEDHERLIADWKPQPLR